MEEILFKNKKIEISANGKDKLILVTFSKALANKINNALEKYYPETIKDGDEPLFKITIAEGIAVAHSCFKPSMSRQVIENIKKHVSEAMSTALMVSP